MWLYKPRKMCERNCSTFVQIVVTRQTRVKTSMIVTIGPLLATVTPTETMCMRSVPRPARNVKSLNPPQHQCQVQHSNSLIKDSYLILFIFTPQPLRAVGVLFSPMVSGWVGGRAARKSLSRLYLRNCKV